MRGMYLARRSARPAGPIITLLHPQVLEIIEGFALGASLARLMQ